MRDYSKENKDRAIYLPALSSMYVHNAAPGYINTFGCSQLDLVEFQRKPEKIDNTASQLNFFHPNEAFTYNHALFSAGHAYLNLDKSRELEPLIHTRGDKILVGDSGGYQVATGVIKMDWHNLKKTNELRHKIMKYLEECFDYSMILDVPTVIMSINPEAGFKTMKDCLEKTELNIRYFLRNRTNGKTKFLNVLQGTCESESVEWYEAIKKYSDQEWVSTKYKTKNPNALEGWAFAGGTKYNYETVFKRLIDMIDDGFLSRHTNSNYGDAQNEKNQKWIHFLGISRMQSACTYTTIQRLLREYVNNDITCSYDSASPYVSASKGLIYRENIMDSLSKKFTFSMAKCFDSKEYIDDHQLFGTKIEEMYGYNPKTWVCENIKVSDICWKGRIENTSHKNWHKRWNSKSSWDTITYVFLMHHNTEMQIRAMVDAADAYDAGDTTKIPQSTIGGTSLTLLDFPQVAREIFNAYFSDVQDSSGKFFKVPKENGKEEAYNVINFYKPYLHAVSGMASNTGNADDVFKSDLFDDTLIEERFEYANITSDEDLKEYELSDYIDFEDFDHSVEETKKPKIVFNDKNDLIDF